MTESFSRSLKKKNEDLWFDVLNHPFVEELGNLELPLKKFKTFIEQDYQYLLGFIKCLGLFLADSETKKDIDYFRELIEINFEEVGSLERSYESLGYSKDNLENIEPYLATESYKSYLLLQGYEGTKFEILGVILPCDWIFAEIGKKLEEKTPDYAGDKREIYLEWVEKYASDKYLESIQELRQEIDEDYHEASDKQKEKFRKNFAMGLKFEHAFLDSIYNLEKNYL